MDKILLTGGSGFLGHYLINALLGAGYSLRAICRTEAQQEELQKQYPTVEWVVGDLLDLASLESAVQHCDTIIHAAGLVSFLQRDRQLLHRINVDGTANLVNVAIAERVNRFIHVSSVAALDRSAKPPTSEKNRWQEKLAPTPYAQSKFGAEREVWRGQGEGLSVAAVYPSLIIGAGNWSGKNTASLFQAAAQGRRIFPSGTTGIVDVRDVARAIVLVLQRQVDGDRFLLCSENLSWKDLLQRIAESVNATLPSIRVAAWLSALAWPFTELGARISGGHPQLTRASHRTAQAKYMYDGTHITRETDFVYTPGTRTIMETGQAYLQAQEAGLESSWFPNPH